MANTSLTAPDLTPEQLDEYHYLQHERLKIQHRIDVLLASVSRVSRKRHGPCTRCGYSWMGLRPQQKPKNCPNCRSPYWDRPYSQGHRKRVQRRNKLQVVTAAPTSLTPPPASNLEWTSRIPFKMLPDRFLDGPPQPERTIRHEGSILSPPAAPIPEPSLDTDGVDVPVQTEVLLDETEQKGGNIEPSVELPAAGGEPRADTDEGPHCCNRPTYIDGFCINCGAGLETVNHGHDNG